MAYQVSTEGLDELRQALGSVGDAAQDVAGASLYEGAGVLADAVSQAVHGIATEPFEYAAGGRKRKPSPEEKGALLGAGSAGIAKFHRNGLTVDTVIGFQKSGYAVVSGKRSKKARTNYRYDPKTKQVKHASRSGEGSINVKPIPLIANSINSGTSFLEKQPFYRRAISRNRAKAIERMESEAKRRIDEITKVLEG